MMLFINYPSLVLAKTPHAKKLQPLPSADHAPTQHTSTAKEEWSSSFLRSRSKAYILGSDTCILSSLHQPELLAQPNEGIISMETFS